MIDIVRLSPENASLLGNIAADVFDCPIQAAALDAFLECPRHVMYLAVEEGQVVGMASGVEYFHPDKPSQFWINELGVAPKDQRKGIGSKLLKSLLDEAGRRGCHVAWVGTETDNLAANMCYRSVEGVPDGKGFVMYEWPLKPAADAGEDSQ